MAEKLKLSPDVDEEVEEIPENNRPDSKDFEISTEDEDERGGGVKM